MPSSEGGRVRPQSELVAALPWRATVVAPDHPDHRSDLDEFRDSLHDALARASGAQSAPAMFRYGNMEIWHG